MQLKGKPTGVRRGLIAASCTLLGAARARAQQPPAPATEAEGGAGESHWVIDSTLAYYHENGRITVIEPIIDATRDLQNGQSIHLNLTVDSLSGSSPNGALTSDLPQTFASPSGKPQHGYTTAPGQLPVDPFYHDRRVALSGSWTLPWSRVTRWTVGGKASYEKDFLSLTGNATIAHDFNEKNTTASLGIYDENDSIRPIGGTPVPGSDYSFFERERTARESRNDVGVLLGVTQIINRHWLTQLNVSLDRSSGYLNDPYKIMSVIDGSGDTTGYLYERRPRQRTRGSVYLDNRVGWERASVDLALRYFRDDWGIHSDTARIRLRWWNSEQTGYWEPSIRWYKQTAADFYFPWIPLAAAPTLRYASSDRRLGAFHALTYGVEYGIDLGNERDQPRRRLTVRVEYYRQTVDQRVPGPGPLGSLDLYPGLEAVLAQFSYRF